MNRKRLFLFSMLLFFLSAMTFANISTSSMPWDTTLTQVMNAVQGTTVKLVAVAFIIIGFIAMAATEGKAISKFFWILVGVGGALGAGSFLTMAFGSSAGALVSSALIHLSRLIA